METKSTKSSTTPLPDWLTGGAPAIQEKKLQPPSKRQIDSLTQEEFEAVFMTILERITQGGTLSSAIRALPVNIDYNLFMRWMKSHPEKYTLYKEAKEFRTEFWAGEIVDIAKADDSLEDVARSKLKIDTLKWLMQADNRKAYAPTQQIDITSTSISITAALEQAQNRLKIIEMDNDEPLLLD